MAKKYLATAYKAKGNSVSVADTKLCGTLPSAWNWLEKHSVAQYGHVVELTPAGAKDARES